MVFMVQNPNNFRDSETGIVSPGGQLFFSNETAEKILYFLLNPKANCKEYKESKKLAKK